MIALRCFINFLSSVLQVIIIDEVCKSFGTERFDKKYIIRLCGLLYAIINTILYTLVDVQFIFTIGGILLIVLYSLLYKLYPWKRLFIIIVLSVFIIIFEMLTGLLMGAIYGINIADIKANIGLYIQGAVSSKLILLGLYKALIQWHNKKTAKLYWQIIAMLILLPISSFIVLAVLSYLIFDLSDMYSLILVSVASAMLLISNVIVFYVFDYLERQKAKELDILMRSLQLEMEKQYYYDLTQKYIMSNKTYHDLKNRLYAIEMLMNENFDLAKEEIKSACDLVESAQNMKYTGNDAVDSLLNSKITAAKEKGIDVKITSFMSEFTNFKIIDICVIIGNIFDNAIAATVLSEDSKLISLELRQIEERISITMTNPIKENVTIKKDRYLHGYGLKSIQEIVEKYNGECRYGKHEMLFIINIIL